MVRSSVFMVVEDREPGTTHRGWQHEASMRVENEFRGIVLTHEESLKVGVQVFWCSGVQVFRCSGVWVETDFG